MRSFLILITCLLLPAAGASAQALCTNDAQCADGNACNGAERCQGGVCQPGAPLQCNDANPCTLDSCDPLFGCQHAPVVNGTSCSDGNACNGAEVCQGGTCRAGTPAQDGQACNTGNPCTNSDVCRGGVCVAGVLRPDGAGCSDGNPCNGRETCQQGTCTPGTPLANGAACGDGDPCNGADTCQAGACVTGPVPPEGSACSDGFACNGLETCRSRVCTPGPRPPNGTSCSDGNLCNGQETCADGICRSGTPLNCNDGNPCTTDSCDGATGCKNTVRPDGSNCSDGEFCNGQETCQAGQCVAGTSPPAGSLCEDGNFCNGVEFCQNQRCVAGTPRPDGSLCADGNVCNGIERCQGGACQPGTPLLCSDSNPCTADSCDPTLGCRFTLLPDGASCDDRNVCNGIETCQTGICSAGTAPDCGALACDPFAGCVVDSLISGRKLFLRAGRPGGGTSVRVQTREPIVTSTPAAGTAGDPVVHGGVLRLRSVSGGFDQRIELPRQGWSYLRRPEENRGFQYRSRSRSAAVKSVVLKDGRLTKIAGGGVGVHTPIGDDPNPVEVTLIIGNRRFCMGFGGDVKFEPGRRYLARNAPAPAACPPSVAPPDLATLQEIPDRRAPAPRSRPASGS